MTLPKRKYHLETEFVMTEMCAMKQVGVVTHIDYPIYVDILLMAESRQIAVDSAKRIVKKYYPNATYIAFTHVDPSV